MRARDDDTGPLKRVAEAAPPFYIRLMPELINGAPPDDVTYSRRYIVWGYDALSMFGHTSSLLTRLMPGFSVLSRYLAEKRIA